MITRLFFLLSISFLFHNCRAWKSNLKEDGNVQVAINNAIIDYLNTSKINSDFEVYHVIIVPFEKVLGVSINGDTGKWRIGDVEVGQRRNYFPSKFEIIDGKLFYWSDSTSTISSEIIETMKRYDILDTIQYPSYYRPDSGGLYSEGAIDYYFCKSNFLNYKKKKSKVAIWYYQVPELNCD